MYLFYIDDAGTCELKKDNSYSISGGNTRCFVLGGILIKAHELNRIESTVEEIKKDCLKNSFGELKYSIKSQQLNCNISCEKESDKECYKKKLARLINITDCNIFVAVQDKYYTTSNSIVSSKDDIYRLCFEHILKSVDNFMYNNKISDDTVVFIDKKDSGSHKDTLIYNAYKDALANTKIYKSFCNNIFAPTINVVYSQYTVGTQLADFIAGSTWSFFENYEDNKNREKARLITKIYGPRVYTYNNQKIGLSICKDFLT